ncbi:uncharacterized protein KGF55_002160 [Candida pseudojiufengensis]|uniref:uncharacterized protein n=1 Tax=Candida pseudojiufengensis TaxID=497109 RepID=UPI002224DEC3|nr:uncharacterized protein KGF55_002160 [Candida pseudojiufengensis]KAI5964218.1 hypothetical protein KGF55_002160 [Candida pseudojiufengensis]
MNDSNHNNKDSINDLHAIELTAHSILSGSLDNLNDNFESLNQSQIILLTRLRIIENRLNSFKKSIDSNVIDEKKLLEIFDKIHELSKRLTKNLQKLDQIDNRFTKINEKI